MCALASRKFQADTILRKRKSSAFTAVEFGIWRQALALIRDVMAADCIEADFVFVNRIDKPILVRLKWGETEYKGTLVSMDSYMNLQLSGTEEFVDGKSTGSLGQVLIR